MDEECRVVSTDASKAQSLPTTASCGSNAARQPRSLRIASAPQRAATPPVGIRRRPLAAASILGPMVDPPSDPLPAIVQRMTEQARRALFFARAEVTKWGSPAVEPEHLLLGIIRERKGPAVTLLRDTFHLEMAALVKEVASLLEHKPTFSVSIEVPFGTSTEAVLVAAVEEADRVQHQEIGPEHLLLGILRVADTILRRSSSKHEVTLESARAALRQD